MKTIKINEISNKLNVSHSAVSQWFSGKTKPKIDHVIKMNELFGIPFESWKDIKSFINERISVTKNENQYPKKGKK